MEYNLSNKSMSKERARKGFKKSPLETGRIICNTIIRHCSKTRMEMKQTKNSFNNNKLKNGTKLV